MKLIVSINDEIQLDILKDYVDGFVVGLNKFTAYSSSFFCVISLLKTDTHPRNLWEQGCMYLTV